MKHLFVVKLMQENLRCFDDLVRPSIGEKIVNERN